jgi:hypothetical protein
VTGVQTCALPISKKLLADEDSYKFIEHFNAHKNDLKDLSDDFPHLEDFYEHQKPTWEALRKACSRFQPNRQELEHDPTAGPAWTRMGEILKAASPYGMLREVDGLIRTVEGVNTAFVTERRGEALARIDELFTIVSQELDVIDAESALRAACTAPLQKLRSQVGAEESLAHITQARQDAQRVYDDAVAKIEEAAKSPKLDLGGNGPGPTPLKPRRVIEPARLITKNYLETQQDVADFLSLLKQKLETAIASGERVEIR